MSARLLAERRVLPALIGLLVGVGLPGIVGAQGVPPAPGPAAGAAPAQRPVADELGNVDLTTVYRFREAYKTRDNDQGLGQYQVAFRETVASSVEDPQGAPQRSEFVRQGKFSELPIETAPGDDRQVTARVRRYEAASVTPDPWTTAGGPKLMDGLTLWMEDRPGFPSLISMSAGRPIYDQEALFAAESSPDLPALAALLPEQPVRLLDSWPAPRGAISALLRQEVAAGNVNLRLAEVRPPAVAGGDRVAVFEVTGDAVTAVGSTRVNAMIEFTMRPPAQPAVGGAGRASRDEGITEALGGLTEIRLAQQTDRPGDRETGAPGQSIQRRLVLQRRWPGGGGPIASPASHPEPSPENSWLTFLDPKGRFSVRHPQEITPDFGFGPDTLALRTNRGEAPDLLILTLIPSESPRPEAIFDRFLAKYGEYGFAVQPTAPTRLPEAEWPGVEAHRVEAALTPGGSNAAGVGSGPSRLHFDGYLLLFPSNNAMTGEATTASINAGAFRDQAEAILKTVRVTAGQATAPASSPSPVP